MKITWKGLWLLTFLLLLGSGISPKQPMVFVCQSRVSPVSKGDPTEKAPKQGRQDQSAGVSFKKEPSRIGILIDGKLFTTYHYRGFHKPIFYPVLSPNGAPVTRGYPIVPDIPGEAKDHLQQKGIWLTHGNVNGVDF